MSAHPYRITYRFHLEGGNIKEVPLDFSEDFTLVLPNTFDAPQWADLGFNQCSHCPLSVETGDATCPFARALSGVLHHFGGFYSYAPAVIEVVFGARTVVAKKALQFGIASIVGLIGATSGCPHLAFFRPMARFHLPFASDEETLYRVFSMYMLGEFLRKGRVDGDVVDTLLSLHQAANLVNSSMAERLRDAFSRDAVVNAVIVLDGFATVVPYVVEDRLAELRAIYGADLPA